MSFEISQQGDGIQYGLMIYDVPQENTKLNHKVYSKIRKRAIRLNLSAYLFLWGMKDELELLVSEAQAETGQFATVCVLPFDNNSLEEIRLAARQSLINELQRMGERLIATIAKNRKKAEEDGVEFKHIRSGYAYQVKQRLEEAEGLAFLFGLTHDIKYALEAVQKTFASQLEKIMGERQEQRAVKKAIKAAHDQGIITSDCEETDPETSEEGDDASDVVYNAAAELETDDEIVPTPVNEAVVALVRSHIDQGDKAHSWTDAV